MKHIEDDHQQAVIEWANAQPHNLGDYLIAIPNGGNRSAREGARLKKQGVKAGVSDLFLAFPTLEHSGLWVEMKAPGRPPSSVSKVQREWITRMNDIGYLAVVCFGMDEAIQAIKDYMRVKSHG